MPADPLVRLQGLLGGAALGPLRQRLRRAYELALPGSDPATLQLSKLAPHEAELLQSLTGRRPRSAAAMQLDLAQVDEQLRAAGLAADLRQALELLDGTIVPRAAERAAALAAWSALAATAPHPALQAWLAQASGLGLLKRLAGGDASTGRDICQGAARVLAALPAHGQPRAALAALHLGDAHSLDEGQPTATLVLAVLRHATPGGDDEDSRSLWAAQGVAVNELARPALSLNLPLLDAGSPGLRGEPGEPSYWPLRRLLRRPPPWQVAGRTVLVCENPNLLAMAADALGSRCAPLVCTEGMPGAAQRVLLQQLTGHGAVLRYHGDFDWPGIRIANHLLRSFGVQPWRFGAADYRAAVSGLPFVPLAGAPVAPAWDAELGAAMNQLQSAVAEEALFMELLPELQTA